MCTYVAHKMDQDKEHTHMHTHTHTHTLLMRNMTGRWPPPTPHTLSRRAIPCLMLSRSWARFRAALQWVWCVGADRLEEERERKCLQPVDWARSNSRC